MYCPAMCAIMLQFIIEDNFATHIHWDLVSTHNLNYWDSSNFLASYSSILDLVDIRRQFLIRTEDSLQEHVRNQMLPFLQ